MYQFTHEQKPTSSLLIGGGVIRIDPTEGVYLHTNETHHSVGIESVFINAGGDLEIKRYSGSKVVTTSITPDETIARLGITFGLSGGGTRSVLQAYNRQGKRLNLNVPEDYAQVASPTANIWALFVNSQ